MKTSLAPFLVMAFTAAAVVPAPAGAQDDDVSIWLSGRTLAQWAEEKRAREKAEVEPIQPPSTAEAPDLEADASEREDIVTMDILPLRGMAPYVPPPAIEIIPPPRPGDSSAVGPAPAMLCLDVGAPDPSFLRFGLSRTRPASINHDGDPFAYAPEGSNLPTSDFLANAGAPGNWWALKTDTGRRTGTPLIRSDGYFISTTALTINGQPLDARFVPFVALPKQYQGARLGDYVLVTNESNGRQRWAIYGDVSPRQEVSELSAALARSLDVGFEKRGTTSNASAITVTVYPGSRNLDVLVRRLAQRPANWFRRSALASAAP